MRTTGDLQGCLRTLESQCLWEMLCPSVGHTCVHTHACTHMHLCGYSGAMMGLKCLLSLEGNPLPSSASFFAFPSTL